MNTEKRESFSTFADIHLEAIDPVKQVQYIQQSTDSGLSNTTR